MRGTTKAAVIAVVKSFPAATFFSRDRASAYSAAAEQTAMIDDATYRLIVYRSSALDARQAKSVDRAIADARESLTRSAQALGQQTFHCAHDAEVAAQAFRARAEYRWFPQSLVRITSRLERVSTGRGRPRKDAPTQTVWSVAATVGPVDEARRESERQRRSTFVLITTLPKETWNAEQVLREYKDQVLCERKFHFMKDPLFPNA